MKLLAFNSVGRTAVVGVTVERFGRNAFDDVVVGTSDVRATATDGWTPGRLSRLRVAAHPFCDNFRLTGCRVGPIILSSSSVLPCFAFTFYYRAKRKHDSSKKLPPKPALSAPTSDRPYPRICRLAIPSHDVRSVQAESFLYKMPLWDIINHAGKGVARSSGVQTTGLNPDPHDRVVGVVVAFMVPEDGIHAELIPLVSPESEDPV